MWPFKFAMERRRKRGLPHMAIYLLASGPKNGVELMDGVQNITRGWWRPTPGSIYPLLKEMSDQGLVKRREDGKYELTPDGRKQADEAFGPHMRRRRPQTTGDMVSQMFSMVSHMEDLGGASSDEVKPHIGALKDLAKRISSLTTSGDEGTKG
jgi:DNA-binding PadR family transcriptional regulator